MITSCISGVSCTQLSSPNGITACPWWPLVISAALSGTSVYGPDRLHIASANICIGSGGDCLPPSVVVLGKGNIICILHNYSMTDSGRLHDHFGNAVEGSSLIMMNITNSLVCNFWTIQIFTLQATKE